MSGKTKRAVLFVDSVENGWARLLTDDNKAFTAPLSVLPAGVKEGSEISASFELLAGKPRAAGEIDDLLGSLGDNP